MRGVIRFSRQMNELSFEDLAFSEFLSEYLFPKLASFGFKHMGNVVDGSAAGREKLTKGKKEILIEYNVHHLDHPGTFVKVEIKDIKIFYSSKQKELCFILNLNILGKLMSRKACTQKSMTT